MASGSGTFSIYGSADSDFGFPSSWITDSTGGPAALINFGGFATFIADNVTNSPQVTYDGEVVDYFIDDFFDFSNFGTGDPGNAFSIEDIDSSSPSGAMLVIGNGTTDAITGTFIVSSNNIGSLTISALNGAEIGSSATGSEPNVFITSAVVPEPGHYAAMLGLAVGGLLIYRRRAAK